jgi:hypothetical protein
MDPEIRSSRHAEAQKRFLDSFKNFHLFSACFNPASREIQHYLAKTKKRQNRTE